MADIEEIPIDIQETAQETTEDNQEIQDIPKKGRGRPAGAKNKAKPKAAPAAAKPKPKAKKRKPPIEYEEESYSEEEEEAPPPPRRRRAERPAEVDRHALASDVLGILQQQRFQRTSAKRNHYASWFDNMQQ